MKSARFHKICWTSHEIRQISADFERQLARNGNPVFLIVLLFVYVDLDPFLSHDFETAFSVQMRFSEIQADHVNLPILPNFAKFS